MEAIFGFGKNNEMTPKVSIILPNYNHAPYLQERLDSIFNQTYQDFEVIILDDASTDNSRSILETYSKHSKVSQYIVNLKNTGSPFLQWKKGLLLAKGDYVWIAESDDSCELTFLETQVAAIKNVAVVVANTKTLSSGRVGRTVQHPAFKDNILSLYDNRLLPYCPILNVSACLFKSFSKERINNSVFADYRICGDLVFYYDMLFKNKMQLNTQTTSYFRQEGTGVSNLKSKDISYLSNYLQEHLQFILYVRKQIDLPKKDYVFYVERYYKRVRDRLSRNQKLSFTYLKVLLRYSWFRYLA